VGSTSVREKNFMAKKRSSKRKEPKSKRKFRDVYSSDSGEVRSTPQKKAGTPELRTPTGKKVAVTEPES